MLVALHYSLRKFLRNSDLGKTSLILDLLRSLFEATLNFLKQKFSRLMNNGLLNF